MKFFFIYNRYSRQFHKLILYYIILYYIINLINNKNYGARDQVYHITPVLLFNPILYILLTITV